MDLDDLLRRFVVQGEGMAMEELVRRTRPGLLRAARRIGAPQDADDAVQAAYLALVRRGEKPLDAPVLPWLLTAVVRIAYRNKAVAKRRLVAAKRLADWTEETPLDQTIRRDEVLALRREVTRLPAQYRDALVLHYLEGLPIEDVAALLDTSPSAVKMRLLRGRALLRSRLGIRLGYSLLWLPWVLADGRLPLGGLAMKKVAVAAVLALVIGATFLAARHRGQVEAPARAAPRAAETLVAEEPAPPAGAATRSTSATEARDAFISGRVVDETGAPVQGVRVFVRQYLDDPPGFKGVPFFYPYELRPDAETGGDGCFALHDPVERLFSIWVVKAGRASVQTDFLDGLGRTVQKTDLRITTRPGSRAGGAVYDTEGRPIPGTRVIFDWIAVHTDGAGRYSFDVLGPPPWHRLLSAPGYEQFSDASEKGGGDGDFRLRRESVIVEPVDARTGASLPDARGVLTRAGTGELVSALVPRFGPGIPDVVFPPGRTYPDQMPDLGGGGRAEFDVHAFSPGYMPRVAHIALAPGEEPPHLRIELDAGAGETVLSGRVEGAAIATIEIRQADRPGTTSSDEHRALLQTVETAPDGSFALSGLPPGRYRLIARAPGRGVVARDIELPATDVVIKMGASASLVVMGVRPDGAHLAGAWIHVEAADGAAIREEQTDADGRASFSDLPAGKLLLCPARFRGLSARFSTAPLEEIEIGPGETSEHRIEVPVEGDFVLSVVDDKGDPIAGASTTVRPRAGFGLVFHSHPSYKPQADTDAGGKVVFSLYPGTYEATVACAGTTHTSSFEAGARRAHRIVLGSTPVLRGRVTDGKSGEHVREIQVVLGQGNSVVGKTLTDREGRFAIACGVTGTVQLQIQPFEGPEGIQWSDTPFPHWVSRDIDLAMLGADEMRIALPRVRGDGAEVPVAVEIVATDASTGTPLDGARVGVSALHDGFWMASGDQVVSGSDGRAECRTMRGERYQIRVSGPEGAVAYEPGKFEREGGTDEIRIAAALARKPK